MMTTDASEALERVCSEKIDVVLTDVRMPELSGLELMTIAREKGVDSEFIFISGFAEFQYVQQALKEGAFDYFLKPIPPEEAGMLLDKLRKHLDNKRISSDIQTYEALLESKMNTAEVFLSRKLAFSGTNFFACSVLFNDNKPKDLFNLLHSFQSTLELFLGSGKYVFLCCTDGNLEEQIPKIYSLVTSYQ